MKSEHLPSNAADGALRGGCEKEEKKTSQQEKKRKDNERSSNNGERNPVGGQFRHTRPADAFEEDGLEDEGEPPEQPKGHLALPIHERGGHAARPEGHCGCRLRQRFGRTW